MAEKRDPETDFLEQLGQRVRTMRAVRGMSRKVLAKVSGISERYIAAARKRQGQCLDRAAQAGIARDGRASRGSHSRRRAGAGLGRDPRSPAESNASTSCAGQGRPRRRRRIGATARFVFRHRPDRPARRGQIHARQDAGEENRLEIRRIEQGDRGSRTDYPSPRSSHSTARKAFAAWSRQRSGNCWRGKS